LGADTPGYFPIVNSKRANSSVAVIDFLRREAPFEFERLRSIGRLEASSDRGSASGPDVDDPSYAAWLRETFWIPREVTLPLRSA
jgi:hypothetical protein